MKKNTKSAGAIELFSAAKIAKEEFRQYILKITIVFYHRIICCFRLRRLFPTSSRTITTYFSEKYSKRKGEALQGVKSSGCVSLMFSKFGVNRCKYFFIKWSINLGPIFLEGTPFGWVLTETPDMIQPGVIQIGDAFFYKNRKKNTK